MDFTTIELHRESKTPLYLQLKEYLLNAIWNKDLVPGDSLPSEGVLAETLNISKATVRQCMGELSNEGYIEKRRNRGTVVLSRKLNIGYSVGIADFSERIKELGMKPKTELLTLNVEKCSKQTAIAFQLDQDTKVIHISRLRYANDLPIVYIDSFLPYETCRFILSHDLEAESLYSILDHEPTGNLRVHRVTRTVFASEASPEIAEKFSMHAGGAMLTVETTAYNKDNIPVEYSLSYSPNSRNQYTFTIER